ncbi:unnamed protein product [Nezara viridula]|nr:unnamed protein product [Nezara viridula]CAH1407417.1 unnamed protein product [Nezara viridula]
MNYTAVGKNMASMRMRPLTNNSQMKQDILSCKTSSVESTSEK